MIAGCWARARYRDVVPQRCPPQTRRPGRIRDEAVKRPNVRDEWPTTAFNWLGMRSRKVRWLIGISSLPAGALGRGRALARDVAKQGGQQPAAEGPQCGPGPFGLVAHVA